VLPVAILAGGLATRLRPLTDRVPKALLNIAGRPFILHQLELLKSQGVDNVVICAGHLGEQVEALVGDGRNIGLAIQYSFDGIELLGTGGALKKALPMLGDDFFVLNGDSYLPCCFSRIQSAYESARRPALMTVLRNDSRWDKSNILFRDGELIEYDKDSPRFGMSHIDFGLSILSKQVFSKYRESTIIDLADICRALSRAGQVAAVEVAGRFYEIGSLQGIRDTEEFLGHQEVLSRGSING
jgi:N-acetyl-alpha-D-muramate 1-phosphate uridylyltransferase